MNMHFRAPRDPAAFLAATQPDQSILFLSKPTLRAQHRAFCAGFPGLVSFAVKANPAPEVLATLAEDGMRAFDVASPAEIRAVHQIAPGAALHYNNPIRSRPEIAEAVAAGVRAFSVDRPAELAKLAALCPARETEVSIRLKLPMRGAAYDFGEKFGATPDAAVALLRRAAALGFRVAMCFHPGTQCTQADPWAAHIAACADVARRAGLRLERLNVGGGFASDRAGEGRALPPYFDAIGTALRAHFAPQDRPALLCEPGRAMVAEAMTLAVRVKARDGDAVFLNDGRYGLMSEFFDIGPVARLQVPGRRGPARPFTAFGPTCDSLDKLPAPLVLPRDIAEGDYILIAGMGAYSSAIATGFNGYGAAQLVCLGA